MTFAILKPVVCPPREHVIAVLEAEHDPSFLWKESNGEPMAIDYETTGLMPHEGGRVVGVGFSDSRGSVYFPVLEDYSNLRTILAGLAQAQVPLVAHNMYFEMIWTEHVLAGGPKVGAHEPQVSVRWLACTYATYRHLASEGYVGQEWGLKSAQRELLGWEETNEIELDKWLIDHGYVGNYSKEPKAGYYPVYLNKSGAAGQEQSGALRFAKPRKSEMWRAPAEILGHYCALDADATWQLWTHVFCPELDRFNTLYKWMTELYPSYIATLVEQYLRGVLIDRHFLLEYKEELRLKSLTLEEDLRAAFKEHIDIYNKAIVDEYRTHEPNKYKKAKELPAEPPKFTARGEVTSRWLKWSHKNSNPEPPEISKNWQDWHDKLLRLEQTDSFNFNSTTQRAWLFYERLGYPVLLTTESGQPATGEEALLQFGEHGKLLLSLIQNEKEISTIESMFEQIGEGTVYYPQLRMPGTNTGRLAGSGGANWQNPSKSPYMQAFVARPGYVLVSCDIASLENVVLTELSQDPAMLALYGPNAPKFQDGYLFFGSQLPVIGPVIRATGYDPYNPTKESVAKAKKEAKKARDISKLTVLSASYGAGPGKIHEALTLGGVDITLDECRAIHAGYWELCSGVKRWERELKRQWTDNNGWLLNGIGRPICVDPDYVKDLVNKTCLAEGTLVLTDSGPKPIEEVVKSDLLWDGVEWVSHGGLLYKGDKDVLSLHGVFMTPDHKVLINNTWIEAQHVRDEDVKEVIQGVSWTEVWRLCRSIGARVSEKLRYLFRG
jgi:hypothetical protein